MKRSRLAAAAAAAATMLALSACGGGGDALDTSSDNTPAASDTIVVGSANFPESILLGEIYAGALEAKGVKVEKKLNLGSREVYLKALEDGSIDLLPEYNGYLLGYYDPQATASGADEVLAALKTKLPPKLTVLDQAEAENTDAVVVTKATATKYHLTSIADLAPVAKNMTLGGPPEWKTRATGVPGFKAKYGVVFKDFRSLDAGGPLSVSALDKGQVDAANIFTTDPNIVAKNWVALQDPKHLFLSANVLPLITKTKATSTVSTALNAVSAKLTTQILLDLDKKVILDKADPQTVAKEFLSSNGLS
jgi:osmoprotectant transport system substrate-binding protein